MTLDQEWEALKPQIIALLDEGWSRAVAFRMLRIHNSSKIYDMCYKQDREFIAEIDKYKKTWRGFYHRIINVNNTN